MGEGADPDHIATDLGLHCSDTIHRTFMVKQGLVALIMSKFDHFD